MTNIQVWPHWFLGVLVIVVMIAAWTLSNIYFAWLHRNFPWMFRPRILLFGLVIGVAVIIIGLLINPPPKVREEFQRARPELFSKSAPTSLQTSH